MYRIPMIALILMSLVGCNAPALEIVRAVQPDASCNWVNTNQTLTAGWYDPTQDTKMAVFLEMKNLAVGADNDAIIEGFNVCYQSTSGLMEYGSAAGGEILDCDDVDNTVVGQYKEQVCPTYYLTHRVFCRSKNPIS